jgi:hypothetical protein
MADLTITVPNAAVPRILAAFVARYGYNPAVDGTQTQFTIKQIKLFVRGEVFNHEALQAAQTTNAALKTNLETEIP